MNQSTSAQSLVSGQKSGGPTTPKQQQQQQQHHPYQQSNSTDASKKNPVDLYSIRRHSVRHQKHQLIEIKLAQFPTAFLIFHCFVLAVFAALYFAVQIAIIVKQTPLFFICTGFWMALVYFACIYTVFLLVKNQTYRSLMVSMALQAVGLVLTLIGTILINCADAALFVQACIPKCLNEFSYQFLNIMMIIAGILAFLEFCLYFVLVEFYVLREARSLNTFLGNRK